MTQPRATLVRTSLALSLALGAVVGCTKPGQLGDSIAVNEAGLDGRVDALCRLENPDAPPVERKQCLGEPLE